MEKRRKNTFILSFALALTLILASVVVFAFSYSQSTQIAYATDSEFTQVFPTTDYFQSAHPTLVSANQTYLLVFDDEADKLFVKGGLSTSTKVYSTPFANVKNLFAVGNYAFINCDEGYYSLDLIDSNATWQDCVLSAPSNISYFNSDGEYLYAHSALGRVCIYDQHFGIVYGTENLVDLDFTGQSTVVMGERSLLYVFSVEKGMPFFTTYDVLTGNKSDRVYTKGTPLKEAYIGDVIYGLKSFDDKDYIVCIDKQNGNELFSTDITPDAFYAYGNRLFTVSGDCVTVYTLNSDKTALRLDTSVTMSGSDLGHFDSPSDLIKDGNKIVVADSKNNRLSFVESDAMTCVYLEKEPIALCKGQNDYYVAFNDSVAKLTGEKVTHTYSIDGVLDVAYLDKLYVLTTDGVYVILGNDAVKLCSSRGAKRIACAKDGTNVYLLCDDEIVSIDKNGNALPSLASGDFTNAVDFAIDYVGKVTVAYPDGYSQHLGDTVEHFTLTSSSVDATVTSVALDENSLYFTAKECFVGKCAVSATSKLTFINNFVWTANEKNAVSFAKAKDGALVYSVDKRVENTSLATSDVYMIYNDIKVDATGEFRYARCDEELVKIEIASFESVSPEQLTGNYAATAPTTLFASPYCESGKVEIAQGTVVSRMNNASDFEKGKWIAVQYADKTYYALSSDFEEYVVQIPEKDKVYGKANADRAGGIVNVYASADENSQIVCQIVDGTKVEVLETLDDYYLVSVNGQIGYIKKAQVKIDGLTTVQIVAIVLSIIVALAGFAIFASIYLTRKNADEKKDDDKTQRRI